MKNLPVKLLVTDFDGTIHAEMEIPPISPSLQRAIADLQKAGGKWMINTGRDLPGLLEGLARAHVTIKPDFLGLVEREIYLHDGFRYVAWEPWNQACARHQQEVFDRVKRDLPEIVAWINQRFQATLYADSWSPFCLIAENNHDTDAIMVFLEDYCRRQPNLAVVRNDVYVRFSHSGYDKGTVMSEVARLMRIEPAAILAAGDHYNDLPMLDEKRARWLVAPANAIPAVKVALRRQGGFISSQPWGHGVADGLQHFLSKTQ